MVICRCCGKRVISSDRYPIHTMCMVRHWDRHAKGIGASRCKEFGLIMKPCTFLVSDYAERWPGYSEGTTWNGFNDVSVTPETLARLKEAFAGDGDPEDWDIPLGENGLVSLAGGFMTVIVRSKKKED